MFAHVPSKNLADNEDKVFLSSGMTHEWLLGRALIAIHNAVGACDSERFGTSSYVID
jgi:hypothetical protein